MSIKSLVKGVRNKSKDNNINFSYNAYIDIFKPIKGEVIPLDKINDHAFNSGALGKGCGIVPEDDILYSPVNGEVVSVFPTKHALSIISDEGIEILIHIGINTVMLKGEPFKAYVADGERVSVGTKLIRIDNKIIKRKSFDNTVIVVITNSDDYNDVMLDKRVNKGGMEFLMQVAR